MARFPLAREAQDWDTGRFPLELLGNEETSTTPPPSEIVAVFSSWFAHNYLRRSRVIPGILILYDRATSANKGCLIWMEWFWPRSKQTREIRSGCESNHNFTHLGYDASLHKHSWFIWVHLNAWSQATKVNQPRYHLFSVVSLSFSRVSFAANNTRRLPSSKTTYSTYTSRGPNPRKMETRLWSSWRPYH